MKKALDEKVAVVGAKKKGQPPKKKRLKEEVMARKVWEPSPVLHTGKY